MLLNYLLVIFNEFTISNNYKLNFHLIMTLQIRLHIITYSFYNELCKILNLYLIYYSDCFGLDVAL